MTQIIWTCTIDEGKYFAEVERTGEYIGVLRLYRADDALLLEKPVNLSYGAKFGPDVQDINDWWELMLPHLEPLP